MKWRSALVYLLVLMVVGGYYYYFEIIQKERKERAAAEARKVFQFQAEQVNALAIKSKDKETVQLKKDEQWKIVEPIVTDADKSAVEEFLGAYPSSKPSVKWLPLLTI